MASYTHQLVNAEERRESTCCFVAEVVISRLTTVSTSRHAMLSTIADTRGTASHISLRPSRCALYQARRGLGTSYVEPRLIRRTSHVVLQTSAPPRPMQRRRWEHSDG